MHKYVAEEKVWVWLVMNEVVDIYHKNISWESGPQWSHLSGEALKAALVLWKQAPEIALTQGIVFQSSFPVFDNEQSK